MQSPSHNTRVTVTARSIWRIRLAREAPRHFLQVLAIAGLLASARYAIAPPRPVVTGGAKPNLGLTDRAAEGFASLFARRYLSWDSRDPEAHRLVLTPYANSTMAPEAGMQLPEVGEQEVLWTQVVQARTVAPHEQMYTVAAQTDTSGLLYLTVGVMREADGRLALSGYPAFVGAPASTTAAPPKHLHEVEDPALETVVTRALRNYLARAESELDADLAASARVSLPTTKLGLSSLDSLDWASEGRSVLAIVHVRDEHGAQYTLTYELEVLSKAGRWEVSAIQINPDA